MLPQAASRFPTALRAILRASPALPHVTSTIRICLAVLIPRSLNSKADSDCAGDVRKCGRSAEDCAKRSGKTARGLRQHFARTGRVYLSLEGKSGEMARGAVAVEDLD